MVGWELQPRKVRRIVLPKTDDIRRNTPYAVTTLVYILEVTACSQPVIVLEISDKHSEELVEKPRG